MRIVQFNNKFTGTGAERVMKNLGQHLSRQGNEVSFATYEDCGPKGPYRISNPTTKAIALAQSFEISNRKAGVDLELFEDPNKSIVKRAGINLRNLVPMLDPITRKSVNQMLDKTDPDIVHCHNILPSLAPIVESKRRGIPVVVSLHGYWPVCPLANRFQVRTKKICEETDWSACRRNCSSQFSSIEGSMKKLQNTIIENVDFIVCVSNYVQERLLDYGYPKESLGVIHNGINVNEFRPTGDPSNDYLFHAGRLSRHKGSHVLFDAANKLRSSIPDIELRMVGTGMGNDQMRIAENIDYLGWVTDAELVRLYSNSLCTIIPSIWPEPHPLTTLEAMACGTPVIGTRISGIEESIEDGVTGYLIEIGEYKDMSKQIADRIEELYTDPILRAEMGIRARERVLEYFNEERMVNEYLDVYRKLLRTGG